MKNQFSQYAISYATQGLKVIPLAEGEKKPMEKGWQKKATADVKKVEQIWKKYPNANIGILTGKVNNLLVMDVDVKNGVNGKDSLSKLEVVGNLLLYPCVKTPSGGLHYYFKYNDKIKGNKVGVFPGIDIRTDKAFIVAPPSVFEGEVYKWK